MRIFAILLFSFLFQITSFAQSKVSDLNRDAHLKLLKDGILLVQLPSITTKKTELLNNSKSKKNKKRAEKIIKERTLIREDITNGFKTKYDFSEIYFVEAKHSKQILKGDFFNILRSKNGEPTTIENDTTKAYYLATYGSAMVPGGSSTYNGNGILIRHINNGKLEQINSDIFFESTSRAFGVISGDNSLTDVVGFINAKFRKRHALARN